MKTVPYTTEITGTADARSVLKALSSSTKSEALMRFRAGVVLLAAGEIGRVMGALLASRRSGACAMRMTDWLA